MCAIPRRLEMAQEKGLMVVCAATHKLKDFFFFLVQSEYGDLYKVRDPLRNSLNCTARARRSEILTVCEKLRDTFWHRSNRASVYGT